MTGILDRLADVPVWFWLLAGALAVLPLFVDWIGALMLAHTRAVLRRRVRRRQRAPRRDGADMSTNEVEHTLRHGQSIRDRLRQALYDAALRAYIDRHGEPKPGADDPVLAFIERAADAQAEMFSEVAWESLQEGRQLVAKFEVET